MRTLGITSLIKDSEATPNADGLVVSDSNTSLALGTAVISPLEMAAAYATIANDGEYIEPTFYTKVEDSAGNVVIENTQERRRIFSEGNAFILKSLLRQVVEGTYGTAKACKMGNVDVAAKTGTTQKQYDVWLCGFTPYYTAATWYGYDYNETLSYYGGSPATLIWANVMKNIHASLPDSRFVKPANVVSANVCNFSGKCATGACANTHSEFFVEGTVPTQCQGHSSYTVCEESGKIATEFCPKTKTAYGASAPEKEQSPNWKTNGGNKYSVITEKCTIHNAQNGKKKEEDNKQNQNGNGGTTVTNTDISVPNVVGKSEADARKALSGLKNVVVDYKSDNNKSNGVVLYQSLGAGSVVSKEATITITVNKVTTPAPTNTGNNTGGNNNQQPTTPPANTTSPANTTPPANNTQTNTKPGN